jgi:hypothetical protein
MHKVDIQKLKELDVDRLFDNLIDKEVTYLNLIDLIKHFTGFENIRLTALNTDIQNYLVEHDKVVDACSYQFGTVFIKKHKFETIYKLWELTNKYLNNKPHLQTETNQNKQDKDLFIIAELLATNEIQIIKDQFIFKGEKYESGNSLNNEVNEFYRYHPKKKFTQYLNDFKSKNGQKYFLETFDSEKNKPDDSNIKRLRKLKKYFDKENIIISNKDFQEAFKRLN